MAIVDPRAGQLTANLAPGLAQLGQTIGAQRQQAAAQSQQKQAGVLSQLLRIEDLGERNAFIQQTIAQGEMDDDFEEELAAFSQLPIEQQNNMAMSALRGGGFTDLADLSEGKVGSFRTVDLGDRVQVVSTITGELIREVKKGTPEHIRLELELEQEKRKAEEAKAKSEEARRQAEEERKQREFEAEEAERAKKEEERVLGEQEAMAQTQDLVALTKSILANPALESVTGVSGALPTVRPETADLIADIDRLISGLTTENLDLLSGVLSDTDIKLLRDFSAGINLRKDSQGNTVGISGSFAGTQDRLKRIIDKLQATLPQANDRPATELSNEELLQMLGR